MRTEAFWRGKVQSANTKLCAAWGLLETYLSRFGIHCGQNSLQPLQTLANIGVQSNRDSHSDREVQHHIEIEHVLWVNADKNPIEQISLATGFDPLEEIVR